MVNLYQELYSATKIAYANESLKELDTIIRIRSRKHDSSTASSHAKDFEYVINSPLFSDLCKTPIGSV